MPENIVIGLNTLSLKAQMPALASTPERALKKRVFTEDEWNYLNTRPTEELYYRIRQGDLIIKMLYRPEMLNMTKARADQISSNLRFQQEAIREIIRVREVNHGPR